MRGVTAIFPQPASTAILAGRLLHAEDTEAGCGATECSCQHEVSAAFANLPETMMKTTLLISIGLLGATLGGLAHAQQVCMVPPIQAACPMMVNLPPGAPCSCSSAPWVIGFVSGTSPFQQPIPTFPQAPYPQPYPNSNALPGPASGRMGRDPAISMPNDESVIAAECVGRFGVTYAAGGCIAGQLTAAELDKCFAKGIGGDGCFGNNNTLIQLVKANAQAARRERTLPGQIVRGTTGVSIDAIRERGILGGDNSDLRRGCELLFGSC